MAMPMLALQMTKGIMGELVVVQAVTDGCCIILVIVQVKGLVQEAEVLDEGNLGVWVQVCSMCPFFEEKKVN